MEPDLIYLGEDNLPIDKEILKFSSLSFFFFFNTSGFGDTDPLINYA